MILALASLLAVLAVVSTPVLAAEETPQWKVTSTSVPTNLAPNSPVSETADVTIDATGGTFTLGLGGEPQTTAIPYNASPEAVQAAFLNLNDPAEKEVTVTGTPGAYVLSYPPDINGGFGREEHVIANGSNLTGGEHAATVRIVTVGRTAPTLVVTAINVGGGSTDGGRITLSDSLPAGFTATSVKGVDAYKQTELACTVSPLQCTSTGVPVDPGDNLIMEIIMSVAGPPTITEGMSISNHASVSGGGAVPVAADVPLTISSTTAGYGIVPGSLVSALSSTRAGAHANLTTAFTLNSGPDPDERPVVDPKDVEADIPRGLIGNVVGMPQCTQQGVQELVASSGKSCPLDSMVGTATLGLTTTVFGPGLTQGYVFPVYNIAPSPGEPAAFGFLAIGFPVRLDISVLSNGDYGVRATAGNISEAGGDVSSVVTIWGVPADHNGPGADQSNAYGGASGAVHFGGPGSGARVPLLSNPTQCSEQLSGTISTDSWTEPGVFHSASVSSGTLTGCDALPFFSSASMLPDTLQAGAPAGYHFDLKVDRSQDTAPEGVSAPDVKNVVTTLPVGTVISPSAANGLAACRNDPGVDPAFAPNEFGLHSLNLASCDQASQVGTVQITSPDIAEPFGGAVYLAKPECEPCTPQDAEDGKMVKLLLQAKGEGEGGVLVKVAGSLSVNQQTGQLTATFANNPQLPFNDLKLTLGGGPRATLSNPRVCGPASTSVDLTPWSTPFSPDSIDTSTFEVSGCQAPRFAPSFTAGTTSNQAGGFSPFTLAFGRGDADQYLAGVQLRTPPGLLGSLATVPLCPEPQASQGTCGAGSLIGHTQVLTGPGAEPFLVTGGQVFLTGPYKGAPFGLSIVVPAKAGPYTLTGTNGTGSVVVRSTINIDPTTSALTVTSDPLPTILDGIPLQLKIVNVTIDRPDFTFNPTSCDKLQITGTLSSSEGMSEAVSSPFQVTNCEALKFKPKFTVSTSGKTSRANGASLDARVSFPKGALGTQANIAKVKVDLPKQLPSRLTTLQKACPAATFESNPAGCQSASVIGVVKASTPALPVGLTGPVYFVSHGGEAFPSLVIVLQGDGVRVDLTAATFISKAGITSSTFKTVPDVPVSSFELYLPEGKNSALAANGNLCKSKLAMPTAFTAQNGDVIHESTTIAVTGCPKLKKASKASRARKASHGKGRKS